MSQLNEKFSQITDRLQKVNEQMALAKSVTEDLAKNLDPIALSLESLDTMYEKLFAAGFALALQAQLEGDPIMIGQLNALYKDLKGKIEEISGMAKIVKDAELLLSVAIGG